MEHWCEMMEVKHLDQSIQEGKRILTCVVEFETGLPDRELEGKHLGISDVRYLDITSKELDKNIRNTIKTAP